jgi:hypothetical protein
MELAESQISERGNERSTAISKEPSRTRMRLNRGSGSVLSGRHPVRFDYPGRELLAAPSCICWLLSLGERHLTISFTC